MDDSISRRAAIDAIEDRYYKYGRFAKIEELVWSIEKLPPAQPELCEDAVSREAVINSVRQDCFAVFTADEREYEIRDLPSVIPKRRTGKWIPADSQCGIRCSVCGVPVDDFCHSIDYIDLDYEPNFCHNCGWPMKGANNDT